MNCFRERKLIEFPNSFASLEQTRCIIWSIRRITKYLVKGTFDLKVVFSVLFLTHKRLVYFFFKTKLNCEHRKPVKYLFYLFYQPRDVAIASQGPKPEQNCLVFTSRHSRRVSLATYRNVSRAATLKIQSEN